MTDWTFKLYAFLHDPPDKPFSLGRSGGHAAWGSQLAALLAGRGPDSQWDKLIKTADHLASGADRSGLIKETETDFSNLRHPLSGQRIDLTPLGKFGPEVRDQAKAALLEEYERFARMNAPAAAWLAAWKFIPARLVQRKGPHELGALWELLPADTRMPGHPILGHMQLTSALANVLHQGGDAALLSFAISPVQSFIAAARRSSDLFAGSSLLSEALIQAMAPLVTQLGPDHVIFPALRHSRLFGCWLLNDSPWKEQLCVKLTTEEKEYHNKWRNVGSLPNRFLAIVPLSEGRRIASECQDAVTHWLGTQVANSASELEAQVPGLAGFAAMARDQADAYFQVNWSISPWPLEESIRSRTVAEAAWMRGGSPADDVAQFIEAGKKESCFYRPNTGLLYGTVYDSVERLQAATKRSRLARCVKRLAEAGLKCSLCGTMSVHPRPISFDDQKKDWAEAREKLMEIGLLRRGEALCGICFWKRWHGRKALSVPSTSEIAAARFKMDVLARLQELSGPVEDFCMEAERVGREWAETWTAPHLNPERRTGLASRFAKTSGEILLTSSREDGLDCEDLSEDKVSAGPLKKAGGKLRGLASELGIQSPRPYLSLLLMDGDQMGHWLSGEKCLPLREYLAPGVANQIENEIQGAGEHLKLKWPVTPSYHVSISEACSVFSQMTASEVLHRSGLPGQLIYAGGDDLLALLPVGIPMGKEKEIATEAALRLRLYYSGLLRGSDDGKRVAADAASPGKGYLVTDRGALGLAFGNRATSSGCLAVFHHRWPLGRALAAVREGEHFAKKYLGRDALAITILRRSGQITHTGLKFLAGKTGEQWSPVNQLQRLMLAFSADGLSPKLVQELSGRLRSFAESSAYDLIRPLANESVKRHLENAEPDKRQALVAEILESLDHLALASWGIDLEEARRDQVNPNQPLALWLGLIEAAAFLARGE